MTMNKRAISVNEVMAGEAPGAHGFRRTVSSEYSSIPEDVQDRLQSMSWRIRSNVGRGYSGAGSPVHSNSSIFGGADPAASKGSSVRWGRTSTMPAMLGTGAAPGMPGGSLDMGQSLKRGADDGDNDAILASAFEEADEFADNGAGFGYNAFATQNQENQLSAGHNERVMRPLPARGGFRPTISMPPLREIPAYDSAQNVHSSASDVGEPMDTQVEPFRTVDFSAYAASTDGF